MTTTILKSCPFCGNTTPVIRSNGIGDYYVYCDDDEDIGGCGARTSDRRAEHEAIAVRRWNQRTDLLAGQTDQRALARQWQKTAEAMVQATYGRGPQAMTYAISSTMRTLSEDLIKAGIELSVQAVNAERTRCLTILDHYAAYEGEEDPFDLASSAIHQPGESTRG